MNKYSQSKVRNASSLSVPPFYFSVCTIHSIAIMQLFPPSDAASLPYEKETRLSSTFKSSKIVFLSHAAAKKKLISTSTQFIPKMKSHFYVVLPLAMIEAFQSLFLPFFSPTIRHLINLISCLWMTPPLSLSLCHLFSLLLPEFL